MVEFKLTIGDKASKKTYKAVVSGADAEKLIGKKIRDKFKGELIGLTGYELQITGGSDSAGFPMRAEIEGPGRKKILIAKSIGFKPKRKDQRKRRTLRGNMISDQTAQVNCTVVSAGKDKIAKLLGLEEKKEEKKEEAKPSQTGQEPETKPKQEATPEVTKAKEKEEKPVEEKTEEKKEELKEEEKPVQA